MTPSRSLPEAIRGCWYYVPEDFEIDAGLERAYQVYSLSVDGTFTRYQVKSGRRKAAESGDYTFDGNFLILRGRTTETYRVRRPTFWRWELEGKRKDHHLLRALVQEKDFTTLTEEQARNIRILPLRAQVEADFDEDDNIYRLIYREEAEPILLGTFFVEPQPDKRRFVGITPLVKGIETATWERIVRDSFLDMFCGKPEEVGVVTVRLLDTEESRVFNYQVPR